MVAKFFLPNRARPNRVGGEGARGRGGLEVDLVSFPSSQLYMELRALFASTFFFNFPYFLFTKYDSLRLRGATARPAIAWRQGWPFHLLLTVLPDLEKQGSTLTVTKNRKKSPKKSSFTVTSVDRDRDARLVFFFVRVVAYFSRCKFMACLNVAGEVER